MTTPELRQLRYFVAVAEEGNITRGAARLMITQQSLSQQINALERQLGGRLFDRDRRGTQLSALGAVFLPEARAVLDRVSQALGTLDRARRGEVGSLRLAFLTTVANHVLPPIVREVRRRAPDLQVITESTSIAVLVEGVLNGRFDAGFTRPPLVDGIVSRILMRERVCAVCPTVTPLPTASSSTFQIWPHSSGS